MAKRPRKLNIPGPLRIGNLIGLVLILSAGWGVFQWVTAFIHGSAYFKVEKVDIVLIGRSPLADRTVRDLWNVYKGRNIFMVDLKAARELIMLNYPEVRTVVVNRVFPDKLVLKIRPRKPVAQIGLASGFCRVDAEGVVLPEVGGLAQGGLPIITGLDARAILAGAGRRSNVTALRKALWLLEITRLMRFSQEHEIHMIDVSDEKNLSLFIEGGIEIKIGGEDFRRRLGMLSRTLNTGRLDKTQIKYIDLRFGNVILGPR